MVTKKKAFNASFSEELLTSSWSLLKHGFNTSKQGGFVKSRVVINKEWFRKTSLLIKSGNYKYCSRKSFLINNLSKGNDLLYLKNLKSLIIEISYIRFLIPFFKREELFDLTEYL